MGLFQIFTDLFSGDRNAAKTHDQVRDSTRTGNSRKLDIPEDDIEQLATILVYTSQEHLTSYWRDILYRALQDAEIRSLFRAAFYKALVFEAEYRQLRTEDVDESRPLSREVRQVIGELIEKDHFLDPVA